MKKTDPGFYAKIGARGGRARARVLSPQQRSEAARRAAREQHAALRNARRLLARRFDGGASGTARSADLAPSSEGEALAGAARAIAEGTATRHTLTAIVEAAVRVMGASTAALSIIRQDEREVVATVGLPVDWVGRTFPATEGISGRTVRTRAAQVVHDLRTDPDRLGLRDAQMRSLAGVPIVAGDAVIGTLLVSSPEVSHFDAADARRLEGFAALAAIALQGERLLTERERAETERRGSEDRFAGFFQENPFASAIVDHDDVILDANAAWLALFGFSREAAIGRRLSDLGVWADPGEWRALLRRLRDEGRVRDVMLQARTASGDVREVLSSFEPIEVAGKPALLGSVLDVTERYRTTEALRESERRIRELLDDQVRREKRDLESRRDYMSMLAHELKNPLVAISAAARVLSRTHSDIPQAEGIASEAAAALALLDDLRDVASIESGQLRSIRRPCDLGAVVRDTLRGADHGDHPLTVEGADEPTPVMGDDRRLGQVIRNVVRNAVVYTPPGTPIELTVSSADGTAAVAVRDHGPGVPPEERERLFGKFVRLSTAGGTRGSGLGLYVCRGIIRDHGGDLVAEFPADGGSLFRFIVPLAGGADTVAVAGDAPATRIALLDDEVEYHETVIRMLEAAGAPFELRRFTRLQDALAELPNAKLDCILLDLGLPGVAGLDGYRRIREAAPTLPIVVLAASESGDLAAFALQEGAQDYLVKSRVDSERLARAISHAIERERIRSQLEHEALHDPLTALPNRALLLDRMRQALARLQRGGGRVALLFMDLDAFKPVNDRYGHSTGDALLVEFAGRLRRACRPADTVARLGGDEFVALCEVDDAKGATAIARRIISATSAPFLQDEVKATVGVTIGIALAADARTSPAGLLDEADAAMYEGKRSERGGYRLAASARA